jgi:valyl-tRNA synthetase
VTAGPERGERDWAAFWQDRGVYRFDRTKTRDQVFSIDTPPPTVSGELHVGHVFSYTQTDVVARFRRMRGLEVFYPMGWDDNGLPTERRVENRYGVRCDPAVRYDPDLRLPERPARSRGDRLPVSRRNFVELCGRLAEQDEEAFADLWRSLGLSVDWSLTYATIDERSRRAGQRAFLRNLARGQAYAAQAPGLWDVTFRTAVAQAELEDRPTGSAFVDLRFALPDAGGHVTISTTRPELLPACVALVVHPDDDRHAALVGQQALTPVFGTSVPIRAHRLADPQKGTGVAMVCTFGDVTDVVWWRELSLPNRSVLGRDGRILADVPAWLLSADARSAYRRLAGRTVPAARAEMVRLAGEAGALVGEPRPVTHPVKYYEKGDRPIEIVSTRQWYLVNGAHDDDLRARLLTAGERLQWHPGHMRSRYENWVEGLNADWLVSRQRWFGVPIPVWYPLDHDGEVVWDRPLTPAEADLPVDPQADPPAGYDESRRGRPGGFVADPDVMDTWATSSLTPYIVCGWEEDDDLFGRTFPMDLRPQGHDIIRTWLFGSVLRAEQESAVLPWAHVALSGWILDPDRKKMSKSKGNVVTPQHLIERYGADGVRYWAALARLGTDTAFDEKQMRTGRRLVVKLRNAARYVLRHGTAAPSPEAVTSPLDRALLAFLAGALAEATGRLEDFDHAAALQGVERAFWSFCDFYIELSKDRVYAAEEDAGRASGQATLLLSIDALTRALAPFLPFVTEEVWQSWREGSVHRAGWPDLSAVAGDPTDYEHAVEATRVIRTAKAERSLSVGTELDALELAGPAAAVSALERVRRDLGAAARVRGLALTAVPQAAGLSVVSLVPAGG